MKFRLGYFVPEFPGQTHIFFWREMARLEALGAEVKLFSTQQPAQGITSHSWSESAKTRTTYLFTPSTISVYFELIVLIFAFPLQSWLKVQQSILRSDHGVIGKLKLCGLALFGARLAKLARIESIDHLHVHSCANAANIALFANLLSGLPYSLSLHGNIVDYGLNQPEKWKHAKFVIVITQKLKNDVREVLGLEATKHVRIAPMGVNLETFKRDEPYHVWAPKEVAELFSVGRLNPCKGHADLIRSVGLLKTKGQKIHLRIAGEDEQGGSGYHKELQTLIDTLNLNSEVELLGAISEQRVRQGLLESHVFTLASLDEPLGVAVMEAMALELPVIVGSSEGVKELIDNGKDGLLIPPENASFLAHTIEDLLKNPEKALALSRSSREKIKEKFQDHRSAELLLELARQKD